MIYDFEQSYFTLELFLDVIVVFASYLSAFTAQHSKKFFCDPISSENGGKFFKRKIFLYILKKESAEFYWLTPLCINNQLAEIEKVSPKQQLRLLHKRSSPKFSLRNEFTT